MTDEELKPFYDPDAVVAYAVLCGAAIVSGRGGKQWKFRVLSTGYQNSESRDTMARAACNALMYLGVITGAQHYYLLEKVHPPFRSAQGDSTAQRDAYYDHIMKRAASRLPDAAPTN